MKRDNWIVTMKCTVLKVVVLQDCTEGQAQDNPWDYAIDENEVEQIDWEIIDIEPNR